MSESSSADLPYQLVGPPVHESKWVPELERVVAGWTQRVRWIRNGAVFPVFVPEDADLAKTVDVLARHVGEQLDGLPARGG